MRASVRWGADQSAGSADPGLGAGKEKRKGPEGKVDIRERTHKKNKQILWEAGKEEVGKHA